MAHVRGFAILVAVPAIMSAGPRRCSPVDPRRNLQHPSVSAVVRVNPVQIGLVLPKDPVTFPRQFIVLALTEIAGEYRRDRLDRNLAFDRSGLRLLAHFTLPATFDATNRTSTSLDLWLVRPLERGSYVFVASVEGLLGGAAVRAESPARTIVIR